MSIEWLFGLFPKLAAIIFHALWLGLFSVLFVIGNWVDSYSRYCQKPITSEVEARRVFSQFFTSDSSRSRKLIAELRHDGMTDEFLKEMQSGCRTCVVRAGKRPTEKVDS
jgi:hypothetical protein